jgi:hypothetical protein
LDTNQESIGHTPFEYCGSFADAPDHGGEIVAQIEQMILHLGNAIVKQMEQN